MESEKSKVQKVLLICGIVSSLLYIGTDIIAATMLYPGYSYASQQVSELSAIGAPTRPLWVVMGEVYGVLVIAFSIGVWLTAGPKRSLRVTSILLIVFVVIGQLWPPMHQRGTTGLSAMSDVLHIVFAGLAVLLMVLFIAFASGAGGKPFRLYSIGTIVAMLAFGALVGARVPAIAAGRPTPWMGLAERVSVYAPLLWVLVLAFILLRNPDVRYPRSPSAPRNDSNSELSHRL